MSQTILYSSPFVPAELIMACGLAPLRLGPLTPEPARSTPAMGVCSYAATLRDSVRCSDADGVVVASTCDQMRRCAEAIAQDSSTPVFLLHVPATWQSPGPLQTYRAELERLALWLQTLGGRRLEPNALARVMLDQDRLREERKRPARSTSAGEPIAIVGSPLRPADLRLIDLVESAGGRVALDASETGERCDPSTFDPTAMHADPLGELARAYFSSIPDAFRRPNSLLYSYLHREIAARGIRGVILVRRLWCDLWHAELGRLREELDIPVIEVDLHDGEGAMERGRTRVESLLEMIR